MSNIDIDMQALNPLDVEVEFPEDNPVDVEITQALRTDSYLVELTDTPEGHTIKAIRGSEVQTMTIHDGAPGERGERGEQGVPGEKGDKPVAGVDYYTEADKAAMEAAATAAAVDELHDEFDNIVLVTDDEIEAPDMADYNRLERRVLALENGGAAGGGEMELIVDFTATGSEIIDIKHDKDGNPFALSNMRFVITRVNTAATTIVFMVFNDVDGTGGSEDPALVSYMPYTALANNRLIFESIMLASNARTVISYKSQDATGRTPAVVYANVNETIQTDMSKDMTVRRIRTFSTSYGLKAGDRLQVYGVRV